MRRLFVTSTCAVFLLASSLGCLYGSGGSSSSGGSSLAALAIIFALAGLTSTETDFAPIEVGDDPYAGLVHDAVLEGGDGALRVALVPREDGLDVTGAVVDVRGASIPLDDLHVTMHEPSEIDAPPPSDATPISFIAADGTRVDVAVWEIDDGFHVQGSATHPDGFSERIDLQVVVEVETSTPNLP